MLTKKTIDNRFGVLRFGQVKVSSTCMFLRVIYYVFFRAAISPASIYTVQSTIQQTSETQISYAPTYKHATRTEQWLMYIQIKERYQKMPIQHVKKSVFLKLNEDSRGQ